jgi:plastocyanin
MAHDYDAVLPRFRMFGLLSRLTLVLVVACGGPGAATATSSPSLGPVRFETVESAVQPSGSILVEMTNYAFKPADIPLTVGKDVIYLVNLSTEVHSIALRNPAVSVLNVVASSAEVQPGHSAVFTIENLPAAVYSTTCPISGHAALGMTGTATAR